MKKLLILGIAATVLNALVVWVLTHFLIVVLQTGAALPPLYFHDGGVRDFIACLRAHAPLTRSADDQARGGGGRAAWGHEMQSFPSPLSTYTKPCRLY